MRIGETIIQLPSAQSTPSCKHFSSCHSEFQGVRTPLVSWAAHALGKANFEHGRSSLKLAWPWFKFHYISIAMDFQCLFSEWEPLKWNTMKCYRSVCKVITKAGGMVLPLRGCTAKPPRSVKYWHSRHVSLVIRGQFSCWPSDQLKYATLLLCARCHSCQQLWEHPQAHGQSSKCCPRWHFKDTLKTYLPNLPLIFCPPAAERQLWTQCSTGQRCSGSETRCHPWQMCKAKEVTESSSCFQQHWNPSAVAKSGEPAKLQSPSHNKIIFIAGMDFYFSSARWDDIQVCNERT